MIDAKKMIKWLESQARLHQKDMRQSKRDEDFVSALEATIASDTYNTIIQAIIDADARDLWAPKK